MTYMLQCKQLNSAILMTNFEKTIHRVLLIFVLQQLLRAPISCIAELCWPLYLHTSAMDINSIHEHASRRVHGPAQFVTVRIMIIWMFWSIPYEIGALRNRDWSSHYFKVALRWPGERNRRRFSFLHHLMEISSANLSKAGKMLR